MSNSLNDIFFGEAVELWREEERVQLRDKGMIGEGAEVEIDRVQKDLSVNELFTFMGL